MTTLEYLNSSDFDNLINIISCIMIGYSIRFIHEDYMENKKRKKINGVEESVKNLPKIWSSLFKVLPYEIGTGDLYVWKEFYKILDNDSLPIEATDFLADFSLTFRKITGASISCLDQIENPNGSIDPEWWRREGVPLLFERFKLLQYPTPCKPWIKWDMKNAKYKENLSI